LVHQKKKKHVLGYYKGKEGDRMEGKNLTNKTPSRKEKSCISLEIKKEESRKRGKTKVLGGRKERETTHLEGKRTS